MTVNVLGVKYTVEYRKYEDDPQFQKSGLSGYFSQWQNLIVVGLMSTFPPFKDEPEEVLLGCEKETLRHEIVHAFLYESGLDASSCKVDAWATNEEMVDWFAVQGPKIFAAWKEVGAL